MHMPGYCKRICASNKSEHLAYVFNFEYECLNLLPWWTGSLVFKTKSQGMQLLVDHKVLRHMPKSVVRFFYSVV